MFIRFGQPQNADDKQQSGKNTERDKRCTPAKADLQVGSEYGSENRCQRNPGTGAGDHACAVFGRIGIAHNGARDHHSSAATQRLQKARSDQQLNRARQAAQNTGQQIQGETTQHHGPATKAIRQRAHH